ncbi:MAG: MBL fold metallo-hydrolase [Nitrospinae bacterium]|nr:MBL fold metallo-hydrolase [Nitrospinota bacterium]
MISEELFNDRGRRWVYFGRDAAKPDTLIDTNEYLVVNKDAGLLLDPGGMEIFPAVVSAVTREIALERIEAIFASHQDPDIVSSLSLWLSLNDRLTVYVPWVWSLFIPHFGGARAVTPVPDEGMAIPLGGSNDLQLIPAHYMHSSGNFSLYDPVAKILFSGDIGAALLPKDHTDIFVSSFDRHIQYMEAFHKRWLPSNRAKDDWVERVSKLDIQMMVPQHGALFKGEDVGRFLQWLKDLKVGSAVANEPAEEPAAAKGEKKKK